MLTIRDVVNNVLKIREAIDSVEIKGHDNRAYISYAYDACSRLIQTLNETEQEIQNAAGEAGDTDGQQDRGTT